mgnify:CR=1 FL=1
MWLNPGPAASSSAICFSFYLKLSVAQVISSKEDAKTTTGSEWRIEDFCLWHSLSFVPFLKVSFEKKLLKTIQNNCFTLLLNYLYFFFTSLDSSPSEYNLSFRILSPHSFIFLISFSFKLLTSLFLNSASSRSFPMRPVTSLFLLNFEATLAVLKRSFSETFTSLLAFCTTYMKGRNSGLCTVS